jgi:hypothetical protein
VPKALPKIRSYPASSQKADGVIAETGDTPGQPRVSRRDLRLLVQCERCLTTCPDHTVRRIGPLSGDLRLHPVIRVYDEAGNVIETHEHIDDFKEP